MQSWSPMHRGVDSALASHDTDQCTGSCQSKIPFWLLKGVCSSLFPSLKVLNVFVSWSLNVVDILLVTFELHRMTDFHLVPNWLLGDRGSRVREFAYSYTRQCLEWELILWHAHKLSGAVLFVTHHTKSGFDVNEARNHNLWTGRGTVCHHLVKLQCN